MLSKFAIHPPLLGKAKVATGNRRRGPGTGSRIHRGEPDVRPRGPGTTETDGANDGGRDEGGIITEISP